MTSAPSSASSRSPSAPSPTLPGVDEAVIETHQEGQMVSDPKTVPSVSELAAGMQSGAVAPTVEDNTPARGVDTGERLAAVHAVRRADGQGRPLKRLPELRQHQRLQLITARCR